MPQPLPENQYPPDSLHFHAFERCLELERSAEGPANNSLSSQMCGRILGYMMLEAPTSVGRDNVQREIGACATKDKLHDLARFYATNFFRMFKKAKGLAPKSSSHPSRPSFDDTQKMIMLLMERASKSNTAVKQLALERDDYRCVVTGAYELKAHEHKLQTDPTYQPTTTPVFTRAAHIFPDSLKQGLVWNDGEPSMKAEYSAAAWEVVEQFGTVNVRTELNGSQIHRVENVLTMCLNAHELFDGLDLWFEATNVPNTYKVCSSHPANLRVFSPIPTEVTFKSTDSLIPLPNAHYLKVHAACAKVAHLSGAAEYLETILDEWEERPVLASDGGSAEMLSFVLARAVVAAR